jgi:solute carrier family 10 (sodium/bile acid cotransporter), member 7
MSFVTTDSQHHSTNAASVAMTGAGGEDPGAADNEAMALLPSNTVESWPLERILEPHDADGGVHLEDEEGNRVHRTRFQQFLHRAHDLYEKFDFPIHVLIGILIAWLYPPLGAVYVAPMITANWVAVCYIFVLFGLGVRTEEFTSALTKMPFNALVQVYNFGFISGVVFGVTRLLAMAGILTQNLADGMAICGCLPMSINVGIVLTMAAGGDEAVAIFNTSFGNFVGVFLSPALILGYLGTIGYVDVGQVYMKLSLIVIVPLIVGQLIQRLVRPVREFYFAHKKTFKKTAEWALVFIIFTIFSRNFYSGSKVPIGQVFILIACILCFITGFMAVMWYLLRTLYHDRPLLRVTGTFISIQKTSTWQRSKLLLFAAACVVALPRALTFPISCPFLFCSCAGSPSHHFHLRRASQLGVLHLAHPLLASYVCIALRRRSIASFACRLRSRELTSRPFFSLQRLFSPPRTTALQLIIGSILVPSMVRFLAREKDRLASLDESSVSDEESGIEVRRGRPKRGDDDDDVPDSGSQDGSGSDTDQAGSVVKEGEDAATAKSNSASECSSP